MLVAILSVAGLLQAVAVDDAETKVLDARQKIKSGHVQIESVDYSWSKEKGAFLPERVYDDDISFQGDKLRKMNLARYGLDKKQNPPFSKADGLRADGRIYSRLYDLNDPSAKIAVPFASIETPKHWDSFQRHVVDPRLFGLKPVPFGILYSCSYDEFVAQPNRTSTTVENTFLGKEPVRLVTYVEGKATRRMWISIDKGYHLLKSEIDLPGLIHVTLNCEIEQFDKVWFPRRVTYEELNSKGEIFDRNVATVLEAEFNIELPQDRFTLAGMAPVKGTSIFNTADLHTIGRWDGQKIDLFSTPPPRPAVAQ
jgi:hypothetical protein